MGSIASGVFTGAQQWAPEYRQDTFTHRTLWPHQCLQAGDRRVPAAEPTGASPALEGWRQGAKKNREGQGGLVSAARRKKPSVVGWPSRRRASARTGDGRDEGVVARPMARTARNLEGTMGRRRARWRTAGAGAPPLDMGGAGAPDDHRPSTTAFRARWTATACSRLRFLRPLRWCGDLPLGALAPNGDLQPVQISARCEGAQQRHSRTGRDRLGGA